ncbi:MAG TPA: T9SS type A sorting domain-containing protein [Candidatus Marinimicrobia bacterium]|nr:T9SS type A sorting domain-containing protein [Candidatus Neomarinimicrobiota bacterium]
MKKYFLFVTIFCLHFEASASEKMWIYFTDKDNSGQNITLDDKAIQRRLKVDIKDTWYDRPIAQSYIAVMEELGAVIHNKSRWLNAVSITTDENELNEISALPFVKNIEPVAVYKKNKREFSQLQSSRRLSVIDSLDYGYAQEQIEQINCHTAHQAGYTGQGVRVLILDTGFNTERSVFDSLTIIDEWDFINNDGNTENEANDYSSQHNHGTMVFSTLAGYDPGNLIGPAFGAEFLLAKTEDVTNESQVEEDNYVAALEWGEQLGADIMSSSLGYLDWYSYCDMDGNTGVTTIAVDIATSLGMLCITSAGNWGTSSPPPNPCDTLYYYISAPADADSVISVGAVNSNGEIAFFSSHGPTYDGRIKPEVCARGVSTWGVNANSDSYRTGSGTSLSAPLVSGAAAVILSAHSDWTPMQVREAMMMTADRVDNPDNNYGYGVIDVMAAIDYETSSINHNNILDEFLILNVYPNPFNPTTTIRFSVEARHASLLQVFDITGRLVETIENDKLLPGEHAYTWDASGLSSGIYFVQLKTPSGSITQKITYLK